jgi:hypothetical protein
LAQGLFKEVLDSSMATKSSLSVTNTNHLLMAVADTKLSVSMTASDLQDLSSHISNNIHEFL